MKFNKNRKNWKKKICIISINLIFLKINPYITKEKFRRFFQSLNSIKRIESIDPVFSSKFRLMTFAF